MNEILHFTEKTYNLLSNSLKDKKHDIFLQDSYILYVISKWELKKPMPLLPDILTKIIKKNNYHEFKALNSEQKTDILEIFANIYQFYE